MAEAPTAADFKLDLAKQVCIYVCICVYVCTSLYSYRVGWLGMAVTRPTRRRAAVKEKCLEKWQFTFVLHDVGQEGVHGVRRSPTIKSRTKILCHKNYCLEI